MRPYFIWAAILIVLAAVPSGRSGPMQVVGSKKFTESVILGEILRLVADHAGTTVGHLRELGGTQILYQALKQGEIAAYPEYTGTIDQEILAGKKIQDDDARVQALAQDGITISAPLGFSNTYALAMRRDRARELNIHRISDLTRHADLRYGLSNEFMDRADGWPGLRRRYQLSSQSVFGTDHDLAYRQLQAGEIDVIDAYTTDARIGPLDLILLEDDQGYFPVYEAVILFQEKLRRTHPRLVAGWQDLAGQIDIRSMSRMNAAVELDGAEETQVAAQFVQDRLGVSTDIQHTTRWGRITRYTLEHLDLVRRSLLPAIVVAVPLGVIAARYRWLGQAVLGVTSVIQTIPALALLVLLMPLAHAMGAQSIGRGSATATLALFLYSLLPVVRNTVSGLQDIPRDLLDSADALGLARLWRLSYVELPLATRSILAGIKTSAVLNIGYATLGALIGAGGLGQPILTGIRLNRFPLILEGAVPAALLAILVQGMFEFVEHFALPRGMRQSPVAR